MNSQNSQSTFGAPGEQSGQNCRNSQKQNSQQNCHGSQQNSQQNCHGSQQNKNSR